LKSSASQSSCSQSSAMAAAVAVADPALLKVRGSPS
jgi:hypothetical protein